jgi:hypothetical protein
MHEVFLWDKMLLWEALVWEALLCNKESTLLAV